MKRQYTMKVRFLKKGKDDKTRSTRPPMHEDRLLKTV